MKISKLIALLAVAGCATVPFLRAEDAPATPPAKPEHSRPERPKLTDEEKAKLKAAHAAAEKDPAVIKAKEAFEKATGKDKREAHKALAEAVKAAMLKADPSLADLFKKYPQLANGFGMRGERGGRGRHGGDQGPGKDAPPPAKPADA